MYNNKTYRYLLSIPKTTPPVYKNDLPVSL